MTFIKQLCLLIAVSVFVGSGLHAQTPDITAKPTLKELLWSFVPCQVPLDGDELAEVFDVENPLASGLIREDIANGYLSVRISEPPCGCICHTTVAAFKDDQAEYTVLATINLGCEQTYEVVASRPLEELFPRDLSLQLFSRNPLVTNVKHPLFYLHLELPSEGTDMQATLKLIPFGLSAARKNLLTWSYTNVYCLAETLFGDLPMLKLKDSRAWEYAARGNWEHVAAEDKEIIMQHLAEVEEGDKYLRELVEIYDVYRQLTATKILFKWDSKRAVFEIARVWGKPKAKSFLQFLETMPYLMAIC